MTNNIHKSTYLFYIDKQKMTSYYDTQTDKILHWLEENIKEVNSKGFTDFHKSKIYEKENIMYSNADVLNQYIWVRHILENKTIFAALVLPKGHLTTIQESRYRTWILDQDDMNLFKIVFKDLIGFTVLYPYPYVVETRYDK